jgi:oxygen-independent coproporphyrinogen-3 oxidase
VRWWNVRHPSEYAQRLAAGHSPAQAREIVDQQARYMERVMLGVRLAEGLPVAELTPAGAAELTGLVETGLVDADGLAAGRVWLTRQGRLLTDTVVRALLVDA